MTEPEHHSVLMSLCVEKRHGAGVWVELLQINQSVLGEDSLTPQPADVVLTTSDQHVRNRSTETKESKYITDLPVFLCTAGMLEAERQCSCVLFARNLRSTVKETEKLPKCHLGYSISYLLKVTLNTNRHMLANAMRIS